MAENLGTHTPQNTEFNDFDTKEIKIWPYAILWFVIVFLVVGGYYLPQILQFIK